MANIDHQINKKKKKPTICSIKRGRSQLHVLLLVSIPLESPTKKTNLVQE
jgi:hypothetical protein